MRKPWHAVIREQLLLGLESGGNVGLQLAVGGKIDLGWMLSIFKVHNLAVLVDGDGGTTASVCACPSASAVADVDLARRGKLPPARFQFAFRGNQNGHNADGEQRAGAARDLLHEGTR
jgi:hypothetical protein